MRAVEPKNRPHVVWAIAFTVVAVVALLTGAGLYVFHSLRQVPGEAVAAGRQVLGDLASVAEAFRTGTVRTTFISYAARVSGGKKLQVAELRQTEVYTREDSGSVFWGALQLPDLVVSATVPVEYTYYLDLDDEWEFTLAEGTLLVRAPAIAFNTPALDVSKLRFDVREASLLRDEDAAIEALRVGLTRLSRRRARDHVALVRETARRQTEEFVATWLAGEFGVDDGRGFRIDVVFADEVPELPSPAPAD